MTTRAMTVTELIAALQALPGEAVVLVDVRHYPWVTDVTLTEREPVHVLLRVREDAGSGPDYVKQSRYVQ